MPEELFRLADVTEGAQVTLSAVEIYNDIAYDLLTEAPSGAAAAEAVSGGEGRGFQAGPDVLFYGIVILVYIMI